MGEETKQVQVEETQTLSTTETGEAAETGKEGESTSDDAKDGDAENGTDDAAA